MFGVVGLHSQTKKLKMPAKQLKRRRKIALCVQGPVDGAVKISVDDYENDMCKDASEELRECLRDMRGAESVSRLDIDVDVGLWCSAMDISNFTALDTLVLHNKQLFTAMHRTPANIPVLNRLRVLELPDHDWFPWIGSTKDDDEDEEEVEPPIPTYGSLERLCLRSLTAKKNSYGGVDCAESWLRTPLKELHISWLSIYSDDAPRVPASIRKIIARQGVNIVQGRQYLEEVRDRLVIKRQIFGRHVNDAEVARIVLPCLHVSSERNVHVDVLWMASREVQDAIATWAKEANVECRTADF